MGVCYISTKSDFVFPVHTSYQLHINRIRFYIPVYILYRTIRYHTLLHRFRSVPLRIHIRPSNSHIARPIYAFLYNLPQFTIIILYPLFNVKQN